MEIKHLEEIAVSALTASYLALTNSSVIFAASGGQVQGRLTQAASIVQSTLTGLMVLIGVYAALFIIIKRTLDVDDPRERSEVYHAAGHVAGLVALAAAVIWLLPWVYGLFT